MKQWFSYLSVMLVVGLFNASILQAVTSQELNTYVQLIKDIDQALIDQVIDPALIVQEHDIIQLVELFEDIKAELSASELASVQKSIEHIRSELLRSKAPRIGQPFPISTAVVEDPRNYRPRDEYLRNLLITGSLVAPGFTGGGGTPSGVYLPLAGGTMTGDINMSNQTAIVFEDPTNSGSVSIQAPNPVTTSYVLNLPPADGTPNQALVTDGAGNLKWSSAIATTSGIQSINLLTAPAQFLITAQAGTAPNWTTIPTGTQVLNIPQASTAGVTSGLISNNDYTYFSNKVNRSGDTMTGALVMTSTLVLDSCNEIQFYNHNDTSYVGLRGPCTTSSLPFNLILPTSASSAQYQVLGDVGNPQGQLGWITTVTSTQAINLVYTATSADVPNTLVLRDNTGSFAATNVTVTSVRFEAQNNSGYVAISGPATATTYGVTLPQTQGGASQTLINDGTGNLSWQTVVVGSAIESLNSVTVVNQYLTTYTAGTFFGWNDNAATGVHQLDIPYAGNLPDDNNHVGLITGEDYQNFENASNFVYAATPNDVPGTLVLRDSTGSFAATNVTSTGYVIFQGPSDNTVSLGAASLASTYTLLWPVSAPQTNQSLFYNGNNQLSWVTTLTGGIESLNGLTTPVQYFANGEAGIQPEFNSLGNTHTLNIPLASTYGVLAGLISSTDYFNFENASNAVYAATPADVPNTLVLRDNTGSFAATNVTVTSVRFEAQNNSGYVSITGPASLETTSYGVILPNEQGGASQTLINDGAGNLSWQTVVVGSAIESLNSVTVVNQYLTTYTAGTFFGWTDNAATGVHQLDIPYAGNLPNDNNHVGLITGEDYQNFEFAYNGVYNATPLDIPGTIVERDGTGSFAATNVTSTGYVIFQGPSDNTVSLGAASLASTYTLLWPVSAPQTNQSLFYNGNNQLSWVTTLTGGIESLNGLTTPVQYFANGEAGIQPEFNSLGNTHTLNIPLASTYGVLAGLISSTDYFNFENASNAVYAATPADVPNTLVLRDNTGSFAATNVTVTSVRFEAQNNSGYVAISGPATATTYGVTLPQTQGGASQTLINDGTGNLSWQTVVVGSAIESLNSVTVVNQYLTTYTAGTFFGWTDNAATGVHQLDIPYAGNLPDDNNHVGLITGEDYYNFENASNFVYAATPNDVPGTLVLRDSTGSFAATNVTSTGYVIFQGPSDNTVSLGAASLASTYTLLWPVSAPQTNQSLFYNGNNQLSWVTTLTGGIESLNGLTTPVQFFANGEAGIQPEFNSLGNTHTLNIPLASTYGVLAGLISSTDYFNFENASNAVYAATSADTPNTLVLRDNTGSFAATVVTVTTVAFEAKDNSGTVSISGPATATTYGVTLPQTQGGASQTLINDGTGNLTWQTVVVGSAIESLNSVTVVNQYLTTYTAGTFFGWTDNAVTGVHQLDIPYAGNLPNDNNHVGLITGEDYQNFEFAYNGVNNATPLDIPGTIVERDGTGSFAATNITSTGYVIFQGPSDNTVSLGAASLASTYTLLWPVSAPQTNQSLFYNGNNQLSWVTTLTGGIESLNGQTAPVQFLTTSTANGTLVQWNEIGNNTNQLNVPYAGNLIGTTSVGLISGIDYQNFEFAYNGVYNATPNDTPNTLVLRNNLGSFYATNITLTSVTFNPLDGSGPITMDAPNGSAPYTFTLPYNTGTANEILSTDGTGVTSWISISSLVTATSTCDYANTVVARDATGSFVATTITLTGNSLINFGGYSTPFCYPGTPFIEAPTNGNTIIGTLAGNNNNLTGGMNTVYGNGALAVVTSGFNNTAVGYGAGSSLTSSSGNIYIGALAGENHQGNNSIFLGYTQTYTGDAVNFIGNPASVLGETSNTTIFGCINLPEVNAGTGYMASFDSNNQLVIARSSRKYKDNIKSLAPTLTDKVYNLRPVEFNYKNSPNNMSYGLIAEETQAACPELVIYNEAGEVDSVNYLSAQVLALDALIKQHASINTLNARCDVLTRMITSQNETIATLQQQIQELISQS